MRVQNATNMYSLQETVRFLRRNRHRRIVYAGGAYDLLHIGHIRYLAAARKLGDILVVGVGNDALVRSRKHNGSPLVPEKQRAEVVSALKYVNRTFIARKVHYDLALVKKIRPNILVLPSEKKVASELKREAKRIAKACKDVKIIFLYSGVRNVVSTTKLIARAKRVRN